MLIHSVSDNLKTGAIRTVLVINARLISIKHHYGINDFTAMCTFSLIKLDLIFLQLPK